MEDVQAAIEDLVELIRTHQAKNKIEKVITSTLFKHRQQEAEAVVKEAMNSLQVSKLFEVIRQHCRHGSCLVKHFA